MIRRCHCFPGLFKSIEMSRPDFEMSENVAQSSVRFLLTHLDSQL